MYRKNRKLLRAFSAVVLVASVCWLSSCEKYTYTPPAVDPDATWLLSADIQPIFNSNCISCHGGATSPDLREGKSYRALTSGNYVTAPAETSKLYQTMTGSSHSARSTDTEKLKVLYWITQGAKNN